MKPSSKPLHLVLMSAIATLIPLAASAQGVSGTGKGTIHHPLPGVSTEIPLLGRFHFMYVHGDNHIKKVEVLPNRVPADAAIFDTVRVTLADRRPRRRRDEYLYYAEYYMGPLFGAELRETGLSIFVDETTVALPPRPHPASIFALVGLSFEFNCADDHHLSRIAVREDNGSLFVALDGGHGGLILGCDSVDFNVLYTWIHPLDVFASGTSSGTAPSAVDDIITTHGGRLIVRGFDFHLTGTEFGTHLKKLGVGMQPLGIFTTIWPLFEDKHGDQPFTWAIDWAEVGPRYHRPPDPPQLSPELLRDTEAAEQNAEEWMKRQERRMGR